MNGILPSTMWTDFYDATTLAPLLHDMPEAEIGMKLYNRGGTKFEYGFAKLLKKKWELMADLTPPPGFAEYFKWKAGKFIKQPEIDWMINFRFDPSLVKINQSGGDLDWYAEGPLSSIWFDEVPGMVLTSWSHFEVTGQEPDKGWENRYRRKLERMIEAGLKFVDFGTRRSFSQHVHERVVEIGKEYLINERGAGFITTSCMHLAHEHGLDFSGTMGHKSEMAFAGVRGVQSANKAMMDSWDAYYRGLLGTFLPDTYTLEVALRDFDGYYARHFDSIRHDSGDPIWFTNRVIEHYKSLGIDPMSKTIIFSDGLTPELAIKLFEYCKGKIKCSFGIGTNFTNDVGVKPLNIVIKLDKIRLSKRHPWTKVVKLSDTDGKITGDPEIAKITKILLGLK